MRAFADTTGAIAARIFRAFKSQTKGNAPPYWGIVVIIVESSALYSLGILAALVSFVSGTYGQYPAVDAIVPLVVSPVPSPTLFRPKDIMSMTIRTCLGNCILSHCNPNPHLRQFDKWQLYLLTRTYHRRGERKAIASKQ